MVDKLTLPYPKPDGDLMLVPTEPTQEMLSAYDDARIATTLTVEGVETYNPHQPYWAMIARSPNANTLGDLLLDAVKFERERCAAIVMAARMGEIDQDFRSIHGRIVRGDSFPEKEG